MDFTPKGPRKTFNVYIGLSKKRKYVAPTKSRSRLNKKFDVMYGLPYCDNRTFAFLLS